MERSRRDVISWCNDWVWTYDPKKLGTPFLPFDLFPRQKEYLAWLTARVELGEEGVADKSRDVGFTWLNMTFTVHRWLFYPGFKSTFGANKQQLVDELGDPDSIFEKGRMLIARLPPWQLPRGFDAIKHLLHARFINPENGNVIDGESGDQMGRGGRSSIYIIDEAAFVERAERVEAATLATTNVRIWVSTANGPGGVFARKRHSGLLPVFTFHYRDDPRKDAAWATRMKARTEPHIWASEYEIDYSASVEGLVCPAMWVAASRELARRHPLKRRGRPAAGLDIGGGRAKSVFIAKWGPVVGDPVFWKDPDTTETAHRAIDAARAVVAHTLAYDSVAIGAGVASIMRLSEDEEEGNAIRISRVGVNTGTSPTTMIWPDGRSSKEKFENLKAELWWLTRDALRRCHERLLFEDGEPEGVEHPLDELVLLPPGGTGQELAVQLSGPKWFRTERGKIKIEAKDAMAKRGLASPDFADALVLAFFAELRRVDFSDEDYATGPELVSAAAPWREDQPSGSPWEDSGGSPWD
jgi:hypothetical protein